MHTPYHMPGAPQGPMEATQIPLSTDCSGSWKTEQLSHKTASTTCGGSEKLTLLDGLVHLANSFQYQPERCSSPGCNGNAAVVWCGIPELAALCRHHLDWLAPLLWRQRCSCGQSEPISALWRSKPDGGILNAQLERPFSKITGFKIKGWSTFYMRMSIMSCYIFSQRNCCLE